MPSTYQSDNEISFLEIAKQSGLSHSQLQIWTGQKVHADSPFCNMAFALVIEKEIDPDRFQIAWESVLQLYPELLTCIEENQGRPKAVQAKPSDCTTEILDFSKHPEPLSKFNRWAREQCSQLLPLDQPLLVSKLVKLTPNTFGWYLNQHHLVTDAASTVLLFQKVSEAYTCNGDHEPRQKGYLDLAALPGRSADRNQHWSEKYSNTQRRNPIYALKSDLAATASTRVEMQLNREDSERIRTIANSPAFLSFSPDISIYAVFATLLGALLKRVSEAEKVSFDSPAGNRNNKASKSSLGCFIEMFPLDLEVDEEDTFETLGEKAIEEISSFLRNAAPGTSAPDGASASNVVLNYFPQSFGDFAGSPLVQADWIHSGHIDGVYDLKLQVHDYIGSGSYTIQLDLADSTFANYDQSRLASHFEIMLSRFLEQPSSRIGSIDILTDEERLRTITNFNTPTTQAPYPSESVIQRIERQARQTPNAPALREGSKSLNYAELWERVGRAAATYVQLGLTKGDCIAIHLPRSSETVLSILAALRIGIAYIPIDKSYPKNRVQKVLDDARPKLLLSNDSSTLMLEDGKIVSPNKLWNESDNLSSASIPYPSSDDLAYVIYTSGSTGTPKGVEIEHHGLADYIDWAEKNYVRGDKLCYPLFTSLSFDLTVTSLFLPFVSGGELIVYPQTREEADFGVIDVVNDNQVDFLKLTPSHLRLLKQVDLSSTRLSRFVLGGEDLPLELASHITEAIPHETEIYNEYGPTEAVVGCMIHKFGPREKGTSVPIGKPSDNVRLFVLNSHKQPVPEGTPGELYIARKGLARGYRNDPQKTAAAFIESKLSPYGTLYKSGDLVRFSSESCLSYLGRVDEQLKLSGHRIEPGEIESVIRSHPKISHVHVRLQKRQAEREHKKNSSVHCVSCGISSDYPSVVFDDAGRCSICASYEAIKDEAECYFKSREDLQLLFANRREEKSPDYDCMVFFSGGKDSAYALCQLVDMGLKVYAFTLDNGYLSEQAMSNIRNVTEALGVGHEFAKTPAMNEIFRDSLTRFSNVCNGCFKTIYTLGINRAHELNIPTIVTGLSRGQFFETRLTENLFANGSFSPEDVDTAVLEARKAYHRNQDAVTRCLDNTLFQDDRIFEEILFVDFYRYWSAPLEELYSYLQKRVPWVRPSDTGRSTNCRVNDVGIYIHNKERNFHNYALPYSWDVRLDQKQRDEAIEELDDQYSLEEVRQMIKEIGYDENRLTGGGPAEELIAYYQSEHEIPPEELIAITDKDLPAQMRPKAFIHLTEIPLTTNGKIDTKKLPRFKTSSNVNLPSAVLPKDEVEEHVFEVWALHLGTRDFGTNHSFFQLGGVSLAAMEITLQLCKDFEIDLPLQSIFQHPTIAELSKEIESIVLQEIEELSEEETNERLEDQT